MIQRERKSRISVVHSKPTMEGMCDESRSRTSHHLPSCLETINIHTCETWIRDTYDSCEKSHGRTLRSDSGDTGLQPSPESAWVAQRGCSTTQYHSSTAFTQGFQRHVSKFLGKAISIIISKSNKSKETGKGMSRAVWAWNTGGVLT